MCRWKAANDLTATKKILEMGPDGVIFPIARSVEEFKNLIEMTLYPPHGTRGFGPMRAIGYGQMDAKEYVYDKSFELCRFVQIELESAAMEAEEIAGIPYLDGCVLGMHDMSGSIGRLGDMHRNL